MDAKKVKYVQYIGDEEVYDKSTGYPLVGIEEYGYRVYTTLYDDGMIYSSNEVRVIPDSELKNFNLLPAKTYKDLYETEFQDFRTDMTDEDYRRCFIDGEKFTPGS